MVSVGEQAAVRAGVAHVQAHPTPTERKSKRREG